MYADIDEPPAGFFMHHITNVYRRQHQPQPNLPRLYPLLKIPILVLVDFLCDLWYNGIVSADDFVGCFFYTRDFSRDFFVITKGV